MMPDYLVLRKRPSFKALAASQIKVGRPMSKRNSIAKNVNQFEVLTVKLQEYVTQLVSA
jgi:hypothetical protein